MLVLGRFRSFHVLVLTPDMIDHCIVVFAAVVVFTCVM